MSEGGDTTLCNKPHDQQPALGAGNKLEVVDDSLAPDAPIHHLLSIMHNPSIATMTDDELRAKVQELRTYAQSAPSMSAKLQRDSDNANPRKRNSINVKRKALLAEL